MRTNRSFWLLAIIGLVGVFTRAEAGIVYETGFEAPSYSAGSPLDGQEGWIAGISPAAGVISTAQPALGLQSLQINGADLVDEYGLYQGAYLRNILYDALAAGTPIVSVSVDVRLDGPSTDVGNPPYDDLFSANLIVFSNTDEYLGQIYLSSNGGVYGPGLGPTVALGTYHTLAVQYDFEAMSASWFVDGLEFSSYMPGGGTGIGSVWLLSLGYSDGSVDPARYTAYFDNLRVTTAVPEPSSFVTAALGLACLAGLAGKRRWASHRTS